MTFYKLGISLNLNNLRDLATGFMGLSKILKLDWYKRLAKTSLLAVLLVSLSVTLSGAWWNFGASQPARDSQLAQGDPITDGAALLRYALPIDNQQVRNIQASLEDVELAMRRQKWSTVNSDISKASTVLTIQSAKLIADIPDEKKPQGEALIAQMKDGIATIRTAVEVKDRARILLEREKLLVQVGELEQMMVQGFPFEVPSEYSNLPQLKGRATVEFVTNKGNMTVVVDGYSAPVTAGNFVDLVQRGFYDGFPITRAEDNFVVQTGDPPGAQAGFIDPDTNEYRAVPLEILVKGEREPIYGITFEEGGLYLDIPVLPFSAYGAVGMGHPATDVNGGSSQFFFFQFDKEITPAGFNLMDGNYAVFGYIVEGKDILGELAVGDIIESATVVEGADNLVQPLVANQG